MQITIIRNFRYLNWFITAYLRKYLRFIVLGFGVGLFFSLIISFLPTLSVTQFVNREKIVGMIGSYSLSTLPLSIQNQVSFGLTSIDNKDEVHPRAASSWEVKNNGTRYIFHLRRNLFWSDGSKFKSFDVNLRLKDVEILALGDYDLEFRLKQPYSGLPSVLSQPLFKNGLVGLGQYRVTRLIQSEGHLVSLEIEDKNSDDKIAYKFYATSFQALLALKLHQINTLVNLSSLSGVGNWPNLKIIKTTDYHKFVALFFNMRRDVYKEKDTRLGLTYAIPDNLTNEEEALGPVSKNSWAYNNQLKKYLYNEGLSQKYLKPILKPSATVSSEFKITLSSMKAFLPIAKKIARSWQNLGLNVKVLEQDNFDNNFDVFLGAVETMPDPDQYNLWHSTQDSNMSGINNPRIDKLLEDGRTITDVSQRKQIYLDFQKYLVEDDPAAFLFYPASYTLTRL